MVLQREAAFLRDQVLAALDLGIEELLDAPALQAGANTIEDTDCIRAWNEVSTPDPMPNARAP